MAETPVLNKLLLVKIQEDVLYAIFFNPMLKRYWVLDLKHLPIGVEKIVTDETGQSVDYVNHDSGQKVARIESCTLRHGALEIQFPPNDTRLIYLNSNDPIQMPNWISKIVSAAEGSTVHYKDLSPPIALWTP